MKYHYSIDMDTDNSLSIILKNIRKGAKVFEFGPSDGYMTAYLKHELECEIFCLEIDPEAAQKASEYCDKMIVTNLSELSWLEEINGDFNSFDYLVFADVLEHLINPEQVLKTVVEKLLKDDGEVLISLPHIGHTAVIMELMSGRFEYKETGLLDRTHLKFFTRDNVANLLSDAGLEPLEWHTVCMWPEQTELEESYNQVPQPVAEFLQQKPDAHVYQFITKSRKKSITLEKEEGNQPADQFSSYRHSQFNQLFWHGEEGFSESDSIRLPLLQSDQYHTYSFEFETSDIHSLRFDPCNFLSLIHIRSMKLYRVNESNQFIEMHIDGTGVHVLHDAILLDTENGTTAAAIGSDPQFIVNVHNPEYAAGKFRFEIEMAYSVRLNEKLTSTVFEEMQIRSSALMKTEEMAEQLNSINVQLHESDQKISFLENHVKQLIEMNQDYVKQLIEMNQDYVKLYEQLNQQKDDYIRENTALRSSLSWKVTAPLRAIKKIMIRK